MLLEYVFLLTQGVTIYNDLFFRALNRIFSDNYSLVSFTTILFFFLLLVYAIHQTNAIEYMMASFDVDSASTKLKTQIQAIFGFKEHTTSNNNKFPEILSVESETKTQNREKKNELVFMLDRNGNILYANERSLLEFQSNLADILGLSIFSLYVEFGNDNSDWYDQLQTSNTSSNLIRVNDKEKEKWYYMSYRANLDSNGNLETIIASGNDVSFLINSDLIKDFYSDKDHLTGLINQYGMFDQIRRFKDVDTGVAFFIQAMGFSEISNYYGHELADRLLNEIVNDLKQTVSDDCLVVRYTESKFVILCSNCLINQDSLDIYIRKLEQFRSSSYEIDHLNLQVDKRIGYAVYPDDTDSFEELVTLASIALKEATIHNSYEITRFSLEMKNNLKYNVEIANKLRAALDEEIIEVYFQKAMNCEDQSIFVIEELSRWYDEEMGFIPPDKFFRIAAETNQLNRLERYMVKKTLVSFVQLRQKEQYKDAKVTINISPNTLLDTHFFEYFTQMTEEYQIPSSDIFIEISESTFVNNTQMCLEHIDQYKSKGYLIALDDFGTEYSSLSILESVDFDIIKIDAHFVQNIEKFSNQEIIKMIRTITAKTNKEIVAEGVETKDQSLALKNLGCNIQQGYYHHRPENLLLY
ncbi:MAG: EAL domain-containing protein [Bacilli bacterium]|nr:EAL domain-containing protein [Bacilli bacterium]MBN2877449.1 EAL domain-containing protein [Bacilli bacterium]